MKQTQQFQLSQWAMDDRIRREDFNADNLKIENALRAGGQSELIKTFAYDPSTNRRSVMLLLDDVNWNEWEIVYYAFPFADDEAPYILGSIPADPIITSQKDDLFLFDMKFRPFLIAFMPGHNENRNFQYIYIGPDSGFAYVPSKTFKQITHLSMQAGNTDSAFFKTPHTWELRGIR
jgi:hypothetical protein